MKSNVSVGPPIDLIMYRHNSLEIRHQRTLIRGNPYLLQVRREWESFLKTAFDRIPPIDWEQSNELKLEQAELSGFLNH
jgi:putative proteasome-type protease